MKEFNENTVKIDIGFVLEDLNYIEKSVVEHSTFYVDWEKLYFEAGYRPTFPAHLVDTLNALARIKRRLGEYVI